MLNTKYAKPKPSSAVAVIESCVDWLMITYIVAMMPSAAPIAMRRRRSLRNSPGHDRADDRAQPRRRLDERVARRSFVQEIGHDHRHQRRVVHDERHHERHEEQEPDLPVGARELQAERDLAPEWFVGLVRDG